MLSLVTAGDWQRAIARGRSHYSGQAKAKRLKDQMDSEIKRRGLFPSQ